ncbi:MAG TPA: hypothetical protein VFB13_00700, partial [Reyranella sp.]|nr:hypothetical protein [Reyranella sp.]
MSKLTDRLRLLIETQAPTWQHSFLGGALPAGATFTRASTARYWDANGVQQTAAANAARFDHDPATGAPRGYLAEVQCTNLCIWSDNIANWNNTNPVSVATDGTLGPDGTTLMYKLTASAGAGNHWTVRSASSPSSAGDNFSLSIIVKQGSTRYVGLGEANDSVSHWATFDFQTGAWVGAGVNVTTEPPRQLSGGRWRIGFKGTAASNTTLVMVVAPSNQGIGTASDAGYTAVGTESVYLTAGQIESGVYGITSYIPTSASAVTRAADVLSLPLTSLPGWDATQGGVLVGAYRLYTKGPNGTTTGVMIDDPAENNLVGFEAMYGGGRQRIEFYSGGVPQNRTQGVTAPTPFVRRKLAMGWSTTRTQMAYDGVFDVGTNGAFALPVAPTKLDIGHQIGAAQLC